ncbi:MAG TPA: ATP-binding protein [Dermatophilaceae bacterium]|nr:ATP-binding protein [Dermatophilaceae bacterium]
MVEEQVRPLDPEAQRTQRFRWALESAPIVRRTVVDDLRQLSVSPAVIDETEIVLAELVSNALRHARPLPDGGLRVRWKAKAGVVEVEVTDGGGPTVPKPAPAAVWATTGRGLRIVRSIAHEWGVADERGGRTVWASIGGPSRRRTH